MIKKISILLLLLTTSTLFAQQLPQQWLRKFKGQGKASDRIAAITTDASGNVYSAGYAGNHHGSPDAFAMKRNIQGDTLWVYYYDGGGNNDDYANDIVVDNSGNCYITGQSQGTSSFFDCFTAKILSTGLQDWAVRYSAGGTNQSYGNALAVDASGNIYVAGYIDPSSSSNDWLVIKYNSAGVQQWADVLNGPGNGGDEAWGIAIAPNGNPTACGLSYSLNAFGGINAFVKQYTPSNGTAWTDTWTNPSFTGSDKFFGLGFVSGGDLLVGGDTKNSAGSNQDMFAIRYDATGNRQWETIYTDSTSSVDEYLRRVTVDASGNVFFTGTDYNDGYVTCINNNGSPGWRKKWNGPVNNGSDVFHGIVTDNAGNVYVTGRGVFPGQDYYGNGGLPNMIVTKYNPNGDSLWTYRCNDSLNSSMGFTITYRDGKVYAGGFVTDTAYINENFYTIVLDTSGNSIAEWIYNGRGDAITRGQFVETDANDNIYCAATVDRLYGEGDDVVLIKYDPSGNLLWEKYYSSPGWRNDTLTAMQFDPSGNLVLCISTDSAKLKNNYNLSLLKSDPNGNFIDTSWYNGAGSVLARSMKIRSDGSVAIAASSTIDGGLLLFFDQAMNATWSAKLDSTQFSVTRSNSVDIFPNDDIVIGGNTQNAGITAGLVQRFDGSGNMLWSSVIDSTGAYDEVRDVTVNVTGDVAFTGASGGTTTYAALIGKIDGTTGNVVWQQVYNPATTNEYGVKVRFTPAGNVAFICRGWTGFVARYYTVQYTGSGLFDWATIYSFTASDREPVDLIVEPTNRIVTAGWAINGFTTNYDYVLAGYNATGAVDFINTYSDTLPVSSSWDQLNDLTRDSQGNFIVTGKSAIDFYNDFLYKMLTIKYGGVGTSNDELPAKNETVTIYPNPSTTGIFYLLDASPEKLLEANVYDIGGRHVTTIDPGKEYFNLSEYPGGVYVLELKRNNSIERKLLIYSR